MTWGKSEELGITGWLVRRASWQARATAVVLLLASVFEVYRRSGTDGSDNAFVVKAAGSFLHGGSPYSDRRFLYLPSSVLAAVPEALLPHWVLRPLVPTLTAGLVVAGWFLALRIFDVPWRSRLATLVAGGLAFFAPFRSLVALGNWTAASAAALPLALLLMSRSRWSAAGVVIGFAVAVKPMLVPLALLFLFARRPRALALAVGVPVALSLPAALVMPNPTFFFTRTLPFLLHGQDAFARPFDASLVAVLPRIGVPVDVAAALAAGAAALGVWCAWRRWNGSVGGAGLARVGRERPGVPGWWSGAGRACVAERLRLVETAAMLMLATFLVSRPAFDHYSLVVLPVLLASAVVPGSVPRQAWFWIALVPQVPVIDWPFLLPDTRRAFKDAAMLGGLAALLAWRCGRARRVLVPEQGGASGPPRPAGSRAAL
ncbi:hypothetical protein CK485_16445 [Streptomyces sp. ICBB 8177]|nr:glycosyltransferase family 87 protein [Streptomyces sp. ICBB 8177]PWI43700.1 hypothetical protein CK485_16445 [Streptomyces sp. ICBB 8177]